MVLKYTNSFDDLVEGTLFVATIDKSSIIRMKINKIIKYVSCLFFILAGLYMSISIYKYKFYFDTKIMVMFFTFILLAIISFILIKLFPKRQLNYLKKKYKSLIQEHPELIKEKELNLKSDKLTIKSINSYKEITFESILKVAENNNKIYILLKNHTFLTVPNEAFKNNDEKLYFLNTIKK